MSRILAISLLSFISMCVAADDLGNLGLQGKVQTVEESQAEILINAGKAEPQEPVIVLRLSLNDRGQVSERIISFGSTEKWTYSYDSLGRLIESFEYNEDDSVRNMTIYSYDQQGHMTEAIQYNAIGNVVKKHMAFYATDGKIAYTLDETYSDATKTEYSYDAAGTVAQKVTSNYDGDLLYTIRYSYDARGNKVEESSYASDGSLQQKIVYAYDSASRITEETSWYDYDGRFDKKASYTYDEKGNIIKTAWYREDGSLINAYVSTFEYDAEGNWIRAEDYFGSLDSGKLVLKPAKIKTRAINYYGQ